MWLLSEYKDSLWNILTLRNPIIPQMVLSSFREDREGQFLIHHEP